MLRQVVKDYSVIVPLAESGLAPQGDSASPKSMIFYILEDNSAATSVLDIGFGAGRLGELIKSNLPTRHWSVDGVDGFAANCHNPDLCARRIYRNIWHGLAQDIPAQTLAEYKIICLLDVIEHLTADTARWLLRTLLANLGPDSFLFVSTPLWFFPQPGLQEGDLEEHLIGVPVTSMMALIPIMYSVNHPLVAGFVLGRKSLDFIEFFQPTADRSFSFDRGMAMVNAIRFQCQPGIVYKL